MRITSIYWMPVIKPRPVLFGSLTPEQKSLLDRVDRYYQDINSDRDTKAITIFAPEAVYVRTGWAPLNGRDAIAAFYRDARKLKGTHTIDTVSWVLPERFKQRGLPVTPHILYVEGTLKGTNNGVPVELCFQDLWLFNTARPQQAVYRESDIQVKTLGVEKV